MSKTIPIKNQRGVALLYLIILFALLGVLISSGVKKIGSTVSLSKTNDTKAVLDRTIHSIFSWAAINKRIPTLEIYSTAFGTKPLDSWGKPLVFAYYSSLTHTAGLCGLTRTTVFYNGQDVAFILLSGGDDYTINSGIVSGAILSTPLVPATSDLFRVVTLEEAKSNAGCYGTTQGSLKILNNELPNACKRKSYENVSIFVDGAVAPVSYTYSGLAAVGLQYSGAMIFGTPTTAKKDYNIGVTVTDSRQNTVRRSYILKLMSSCN